MNTALTLLLALPLLGFLYCALIGWRLPRQMSGLIASIACGAAFAAALGVLLGLLAMPAEERRAEILLGPWIDSGNFHAPFGFLVDPLSGLMICIVTGVGFLIHVYATAYMRDHHGHLDPGYNRFFAFMNLFVLAMLVLVLANNFALLTMGWGGVGVCSYFLIAFWYEKPENAAAGVKAFVVNAIGDVGLFLATFLTFWTFGRVDYDGVFKAVQGGQGGSWDTIAFLLLVAAAAKSAQLPLHVWLPDAMAGPTPVSALIHAATMVTAGVYLIARAHPLFEHAPNVMTLVAVIGALTAFYAATVALVQQNLKRVIAYSTLSQLGYMFAGVGIGAFGASIFHLTTHAFFKACLFLAAGMVIHELAGEEDMRLMGGLRRRLPIVWACFGIGALANAGFPLTAGFFSKDEIVSAAFATGNSGIAGLGAILLVTSGLTGFYMLRAHFLTFHGQPAPEQDRLIDPHGHGPSGAMVIPVVILALLALFGGWPYAVVGAFLEPTFARYGGQVVEGGGPLSAIAVVTALVGLVGIGLAWLFYERDRSLPRRLGHSMGGLYAFLRNAWYIDDFYRGALVVPGRVLAMALSGPVDNWVVDGAVRGVAATVRWIGAELGSIQTGFVRNYALAILAGVVVILGYMMRAGG